MRAGSPKLCEYALRCAEIGILGVVIFLQYLLFC